MGVQNENEGIIGRLGRLVDMHPAALSATIGNADVAGLAQEIIDSRNRNNESARNANLRRHSEVGAENVVVNEFNQAQ